MVLIGESLFYCGGSNVRVLKRGSRENRIMLPE